MPPTNQPQPEKTLQEVVDALGLYPVEAFRFVEEGLSFTVNQIHGPAGSEQGEKHVSRHISGQDLSEGLRQYALLQWGLLARTVLRRWNITCTHDFGRIVFALIEAGHMQKTEEDCLEDFRDAFDFKNGFETGYRIEQQS